MSEAFTAAHYLGEIVCTVGRSVEDGEDLPLGAGVEGIVNMNVSTVGRLAGDARRIQDVWPHLEKEHKLTPVTTSEMVEAVWARAWSHIWLVSGCERLLYLHGILMGLGQSMLQL